MQENTTDPIPFEQLNLNYYEPAARPEIHLLDGAGRSKFGEIENGLTQKQATHESQRCFSCGNCPACDNCWTLCPDVAVLKTQDVAADSSHYVFDYGYCKGCGLCARECPSGYIVMHDEM